MHPKDLQMGSGAIISIDWPHCEPFFKFLNREKVKKYLQIQDKWLNVFPKVQEFYVAAHIRRGDYINLPGFSLIKIESYIKAFEKYNIPRNKVFWISDASHYNFYDSEKEGISFLPDFMMLYHSDILFRANSTFSFVAGLMDSNQKVFSPKINEKDLNKWINVDFIIGNNTKIEKYSPDVTCFVK